MEGMQLCAEKTGLISGGNDLLRKVCAKAGFSNLFSGVAHLFFGGNKKQKMAFIQNINAQSADIQCVIGNIIFFLNVRKSSYQRASGLIICDIMGAGCLQTKGNYLFLPQSLPS